MRLDLNYCYLLKSLQISVVENMLYVLKLIKYRTKGKRDIINIIASFKAVIGIQHS